jgi:hypothetical protein
VLPGGFYFIEDLQLGRHRSWDDSQGAAVISDVLQSWIDQKLIRYSDGPHRNWFEAKWDTGTHCCLLLPPAASRCLPLPPAASCCLLLLVLAARPVVATRPVVAARTASVVVLTMATRFPRAHCQLRTRSDQIRSDQLLRGS